MGGNFAIIVQLVVLAERKDFGSSQRASDRLKSILAWTNSEKKGRKWLIIRQNFNPG
jgi:hypothetical protein